MKHAVILAHPAVESLNRAIANAYVDAVRGVGHEVELRDLYAMDFDPCLKASEIPGPATPEFAPDVVAERRRLADVDVFAFVYPFWFNAPPAILKGYVDRVFSMGFGFSPVFGGTEPQLQGKGLISFTTSGAPDRWVSQTGALGDLMKLFDAHLAAVTGLKVIDHAHFGGMVTGVTPEAVAEVLHGVKQAVRRHFHRRQTMIPA
jgi:NAD(P)H dehydrogenase (quinone)